MFRLSIISAYPFQRNDSSFAVFLNIPSLPPFDSFPLALFRFAEDILYVQPYIKAKFDTQRLLNLISFKYLDCLCVSVTQSNLHIHKVRNKYYNKESNNTYVTKHIFRFYKTMKIILLNLTARRSLSGYSFLNTKRFYENF